MSESGEAPREAGLLAESVSSDLFDDEELDNVVVGTIEGSTVPERDEERLRSTLRSAQYGEEIELTLGTGEVQATRRGKVVGSKGPRCSRAAHLDWHFALEVAVPLDEDEPTRFYRIGTGDDRLDPWFVFSYQYHPDLGLMNEDSETAHGWAIDAIRNP